MLLIVLHIGREEWLKYRNDHDGRRMFQIDLALAIMEFGIKLDWEHPFDDANRPEWIHQKT